MTAQRSAANRLVTVAPGVDLAVHDTASTGDAATPPMVLLHGMASTHHWWDLVAARLPGRRVIRWDHRGHGRSTTPPGRYQVEDLAGDAAAVLDALHLQRCVLVGHSLGAAVALALAAHRPDLAAAMCCVDGGLYDPKVMFGASWWDAQPALRIDRRIAPSEAMLTAWAAGVGLPPAAVPALLANYQPEPAHAADAVRSADVPHTGPGESRRFRLRLAAEHEGPLAHSLWSQDPAALLTRIDCPVTAVIARTADAATAEARRRALHHTLDAAQRPVTEVWLDGGHDLPLEQPGKLARMLTGAGAASLAGRSA